MNIFFHKNRVLTCVYNFYVLCKNIAWQSISSIEQDFSSQDRVVIMLPTTDWWYHVSRPQHIARALAKDWYKVFYLSHRRQGDNFSGIIRDPKTGVYLASSIFLVRKLLLQKNFTKIFVYSEWLQNTFLLYFLRGFKYILIYDLVDTLELMALYYPWLEKKHDYFLWKADIVMAVSEKLYKENQLKRSDIYHFSNKVFFEDFKVTWCEQLSLWDLTATMKSKPMVWFYGLYGDWLDYDLLSHVIDSLPEYNFVFIGQSYGDATGLENLKKRSNFFDLGFKNYYDLKYYASQFSVLLLPFKINNITNSADPIKLYEYWSLWIPVVATMFQEVKKYPEYVLLALDKNEFVSCIKKWAEQLSIDQVYCQNLQSKALEFDWHGLSSILKK